MLVRTDSTQQQDSFLLQPVKPVLELMGLVEVVSNTEGIIQYVFAFPDTRSLMRACSRMYSENEEIHCTNMRVYSEQDVGVLILNVSLSEIRRVASSMQEGVYNFKSFLHKLITYLCVLSDLDLNDEHSN